LALPESFSYWTEFFPLTCTCALGIDEKKGKKEGQRHFLIMTLKDRFGKLSKQFEIEIRKSNFTTLVKLRKSLFNFSSIDDVYRWWDQYGKPIKKN